LVAAVVAQDITVATAAMAILVVVEVVHQDLDRPGQVEQAVQALLRLDE
jgi:hypothetical protein